ncbi:MAG: glutamate--tRNA ligase [Candidatus Gracilibacteria bacterium]|nr:glutamate--tRNA ligase [Candidatus Gracilibacteria bacterium]
MTVVTRFAPSPTGYVHIGSLRTVLYNYLFAKKHSGKFMLRIEDTDRTRYVEGSVENMLGVLANMGLIPDEGPNNPGDLGPYFQSERLDIYKKYIEQLVQEDKAYYCFCSSERLDELRKEQTELGLPTKYDKKCRYLSLEEIKEKLASGVPYTVRLKVPENKEVVFDDVIKGKVKVMSKDVDEQVLLKSDGFPTYHLANVVDDHLMGVTHVIRGDEWTPSTPKHILLYEAFGWKPPVFAHIPLLLGTDKKKLSKRTGDVAVEAYIEKGYLSEAIINYIALLGWNPKTTEEFFSMNELIERFELEQVHKAGAVFDVERLNFFNSYYLKNSSTDYLYDKLCNYLAKYSPEFLEKIKTFSDDYNKKVLGELKTKIKKFDEFEENTRFLYGEANIPAKDLLLNEKMKVESIGIAKIALELALDVVSSNSDFSNIDEVRDIFIEKIKNAGLKNGQVLWPVRCALSGEQYSPGALELIYILGNQKSSERLEKILKEI